ncbi:MAG: hypothetical protein O2960_02650 [Verrucomicrobia bacterium]|nr:hypothetical protein [Verrucomicrobiota bacterium]
MIAQHEFSLGSLFGPLSQWLGFGYQRRRKAKDDYLLAICSLRSEAAPHQEFAEFYDATKGRIREAVFKLRPFLSRSEAARLTRLWLEYDGLENTDLDLQNEHDWAVDLHKIAGETLRKPSQIIADDLNRFDEIGR